MADDPESDEDDSLPLRELARIAGGRCHDCGAAFTAREAVWSIALGFKNAPRCLACLAKRLGRGEDDLRTSLTEYVHRRECYLRAWKEAERMDTQKTPAPTASRERERPDEDVPVALTPNSWATEQEWDAGDMGCGELVMALRLRMKNLPAGGVIRVTATDPAAPEDLPAWCRLTGHTLVSAGHPAYVIRRKED
jgi:tRNA 2-thiouridine synthesizing protein A